MTSLTAAPQLSPQQVRDEIRARLLESEGDRVVAIYLFGSRAKGTARPRSDWDVGLIVRDRIEDWADESQRIGAVFYGSAYSVDLHVFDVDEFEDDRDIPGTLPRAIARHGETLYELATEPHPGTRSRVD